MSGESTVSFVAGYASGVAGLVVGSPLDLIKVRIQTKGTSDKSSLGILRNIVRDEGATALFKGITSPIIGIAALNSILFVSYGEIIRFLSYLQKPSSPDAPPPVSHVLAAGFGAGVACFIASTPTELIKCRMQVLRSTPEPTLSLKSTPFATVPKTSLVSVTSEILRKSGIRGLYKGGAVTICRDAPGYMVYFGTYELILRGVEQVRGPSSCDRDRGTWDWTDALTYLFAGGFAGCASWASVYPLDVLKSRIQTSDLMIESGQSHLANVSRTPQNQVAASLQSPRNPPPTTLAFAKSIYQNEGLKVFTHGLAPTMFRAFPVNAVTFLVFEGIKALCE